MSGKLRAAGMVPSNDLGPALQTLNYTCVGHASIFFEISGFKSAAHFLSTTAELYIQQKLTDCVSPDIHVVSRI